MASNAQTKKQAPGAIGPSIWSASGLTSAGLGAAERASGWASPALPSARSVSALGGERTRGLSIAVLKEDKEMVLEGPLSPGQGCAVSSGNGSGSKSPASVSTQRKASITTTAAETPRTAKTGRYSLTELRAGLTPGSHLVQVLPYTWTDVHFSPLPIRAQPRQST